MIGYRPGSFGWLRDLPDHRDLAPEHPRVAAACRDLVPGPRPRPKRLDWSEYFPPADDQGLLPTCASHACAALAGYFERRSSGSATKTSRLFLYQMTRRLARGSGNCGAELRTTLKALSRFGLPPERYWPYDPARLGDEPDPFLFAYASEYRALMYVRLDTAGVASERLLRRIKAFLAGGFPCAFGFSVFESLSSDADIPSPTLFDTLQGGCAAVAVGYDDTRRIRSAKGALRVRCSWGGAWGDGGYGWLPYAYVGARLAVDFWTMLRPDWLASGEFLGPDDSSTHEDASPRASP